MIKKSNFFIFFLIIFLFNLPVLSKEIKEGSNEDINYLLNNTYKSDRVDWFGMYIKDQNGEDLKIGYSNIKVEQTENENNEKLILFKFFFLMNFKSYGLDSIFESSLFETYQAEPPFNFLNSSSYTIGSKLNNSSITTLVDNKFTYQSIDNDKITQFENLNFEYNLNKFLVFESLAVKNKLNVGDIYYSTRIQEDKLITDKNTILEINNVTIDGIKQKYYKIKYFTIGEDENTESIIYGNEEKIISFEMDLGGGFIINSRLEPKEKATDLSYTADLYILNSIHLNENFRTKNIFGEILDIAENENTNVDYLNFKVVGEFDESFNNDYINQQVVKQNNQFFINLGYNYEFNFEKVSEEFYKEAFDFSINNPELVKIANEALSNPIDQYDKIEQIISWIQNNTTQFAEKDEVTDPYEILNNGGGDCTEITELFNSLVKSLGIPARSVNGYVLDLEGYAFGGHRWSEIEIDGFWLPVDATWNMWVDSSLFHIQVKNIEDTFENLTKKFKLNIDKVSFSNGKIISYDDEGDIIVN